MKKNDRICKSCHYENGKIWRKLNPEKVRKNSLKNYRKNKRVWFDRSNKYRRKLRIEVIVQYGGKCCNCGTDDFDVLDLDHIDNDGAADRKINLFGHNLYRLLKKQGFPKKRFQLLCKNCNWKKEIKRRNL